MNFSEEISSKLSSVFELRQENKKNEPNSQIQKMLKKPLVNPSKFFFRKQSHHNHTHLNESSKCDEENSEDIESSQAPFKFHRKKRETQVFVESETDFLKENTPFNSATIHIRKKPENETMKEMSEMLELQKKIELNRFLYEKFRVFLQKNEESEWKGLEDDFQEEDQYKEALENNSQENRENSCFLEIVEMSDIEKSFIDLNLLDKRMIYYKIKLIFLTFRKYKNCNFFSNFFE